MALAGHPRPCETRLLLLHMHAHYRVDHDSHIHACVQITLRFSQCGASLSPTDTTRPSTQSPRTHARTQRSRRTEVAVMRRSRPNSHAQTRKARANRTPSTQAVPNSQQSLLTGENRAFYSLTETNASSSPHRCDLRHRHLGLVARFLWGPLLDGQSTGVLNGDRRLSTTFPVSSS